MRITISHNKPKPDVIKAVDKGVEQAFQGVGVSFVQLTDTQKSWNGDTMTFSLVAKAGFLNAPIKGTVLVTDRDVTLDVDLGVLEKFISAETAKATIESHVKGLLA